MLSEFVLASIQQGSSSSHQASGANIPPVKDAAIFKLAIDPNSRSTPTIFKASTTPCNGLAYNSTHIFAAQADKSTIHVYSFEKGNQEATIPFPEKITAVSTIGDDGEYLILGSASGNVMIWETFSGRLVKAEQAHVQRVTAISCDPSGLFFLTGSSDSTVLVWSLLNIIASSDSLDSWQPDQNHRAPEQNLTAHRAGITAISCGHSSPASNIALSISEDRMALIWHYTEGHLLRSYLLDDIPLSIAIDPADRAFYVGYEAGGVQMVDMYDLESSDTPIQPSDRHMWTAPVTPSNSNQSEFNDTLCLSVSFDGSKVVSGHESGRICVWDISEEKFEKELCQLPGPVTNILYMSPTGLVNDEESTTKLHTVTKPKFDSNAFSDVVVTTELLDPIDDVSTESWSSELSNRFSQAFIGESFSGTLLMEAIQDQQNTNDLRTSKADQGSKGTGSDEFIALDDNEEGSGEISAERQIQLLKDQLASLQRTQKESFKALSQVRQERDLILRQLKEEEDADEEDEDEEDEDEEEEDEDEESD